MINSSDALRRYGNPHDAKNMGLYYLPDVLLKANPKLPKRIYANIDVHKALNAALMKCLDRGVLNEIEEFSGCFNIRMTRSGRATSLHSWGLAVDWNAQDNPMGEGFTYDYLRSVGCTPFTEKFLQAWRDTGWDCGGDWGGTQDRMHFQIARLP